MASSLKLYNTLTRDKVDFTPIDPDNVRMYVCGPTVYDFAHIGNARPVIVFDVLFRLLRHVYGEAHVTYVRNITDVDDKINARALRDFPDLPLNDAIHAVTEKTEAQFHADVAALGCLEPTVEPRATGNILQMIAIIQRLLDKGFAYIVQGSEGREALFDVRSMPDYGSLSKRRLDEQQAGARISVEAHKRSPADFVLWKESAPNEPGWDAAFQISDENRDELRLNNNRITIFGRPGWHIECSAMSERYLGETFDIHGGGLDLIFPHHENEIAQSRCAHGTKVMANVWMHNGFVQVEGKKMSKSDGNFVTINELLETEKFGGRKWPGEVLRLAMLMTHYRQPIDFSVNRLDEAENILQSWADAKKIASDHNWVAVANRVVGPFPNAAVVDALSDDLNMSEALAILQRWTKDANRGDVDAAFNLVNGISFLGFTLDDFVAEAHVEAIEKILIGEKIQTRLALLAAKNFAEADRIRDELLQKGIQLVDSKDPVTGERVTTWEVKR